MKAIIKTVSGIEIHFESVYSLLDYYTNNESENTRLVLKSWLSKEDNKEPIDYLFVAEKKKGRKKNDNLRMLPRRKRK